MMRLVCLVSLCIGLAQPVSAAVVSIVNGDAPGEGLNDPTVVAPVGGNPGTTLGEQRLIAFQQAADIWGAVLSSAVEIEVEATFDVLSCDEFGATLGAAGPTTVHRDFAGAPRPQTWYPQALANSIAGVDLDPEGDVFAFFNSALGTTCAFPAGWYYGLDAAPPGGDIDFVSVALHEIGHGLGFLSLVGLSSGAKFDDRDDSYMVHLEDRSEGLLFPEMTNGQRRIAQIDDGDLFWTGASVATASAVLVGGSDPLTGAVEIYAPDPLEPGSSVSHFSTTLTPSELMEPFYDGANHDPGLALDLMLDIGWNCGDGALEGAEECDDGNPLDGDGCSALCVVEQCHDCVGVPSVCSALTGPSCDDGQACTFDDACVAGECVADATPQIGCLSGTQPGKGLLLLKDKANDKRDKVIWKWLKGEETVPADFADPDQGTDYLLCVYDQSGGDDNVVMSLQIPGGAAWQAKSSGFKYRDKSTLPDGVKIVVLKQGDEGKAKIVLKGKGALLPMPDLGALVPPLTVQLGNGSTCWESTFGTEIQKNEPDFFKAKAD